jgi:hypothetical protein
MFDDVKRAWSQLDDVQDRMLRVTGVAWSADQTVKVVVGPRGQLMELEIDPRVYRRPNSKALAAAIVATSRLAVEDVTRQVKAILDETVPADLRLTRVGGVDVDTLMHSHDADVRRREATDDE